MKKYFKINPDVGENIDEADPIIKLIYIMGLIIASSDESTIRAMDSFGCFNEIDEKEYADAINNRFSTTQCQYTMKDNNFLQLIVYNIMSICIVTFWAVIFNGLDLIGLIIATTLGAIVYTFVLSLIHNQ